MVLDNVQDYSLKNSGRFLVSTNVRAAFEHNLPISLSN